MSVTPIATDMLHSLITSSEASQLAGVSVAAICNWRERGYLGRNAATGEEERIFLTPACYRRGKPLYVWLDVAKAERATRDRARRKFSNAA